MIRFDNCPVFFFYIQVPPLVPRSDQQELLRLHHPGVHLRQLHHLGYGAAQHPTLVRGKGNPGDSKQHLYSGLHNRNVLKGNFKTYADEASAPFFFGFSPGCCLRPVLWPDGVFQVRVEHHGRHPCHNLLGRHCHDGHF